MRLFFEDYLKQLETCHKEFEQAIEGLSIEALDWEPEPGIDCLWVLINYAVDKTRFWVGNVMVEMSGRSRIPVETTEANLKAYLSENRTFVREILEKLTLDDLEQPRIVPGGNQTTTVGAALHHALDRTAWYAGQAQITRHLVNQRWDAQANVKRDVMDELRIYGELQPIEGFNIVTIHPLADEIALLEKLNMRPEQCIFADFHWAFQNELIFVSVASSKDSLPFASYTVETDEHHRRSFHIVTADFPLTSQTIQNVLLNLRNWWTQNEPIIKRQTNQISNLDLGFLQVSQESA